MFRISGFTDEVTGKLSGQLDLMRELKQEYMCPRSVNGKNIAEYTSAEFERDIMPQLVRAGIKLSSLGSPIGKISLGDEKAYKRQLAQLGELVKIADAAGCRYIRIFSFFPDTEVSSEECFERVKAKLEGFLKVCEGSNVTLIHENEKKIYGDTPERVLRLVKELDNPRFALCYDASNYIQCGVDALEAYNMTKDYTVYYHMKDCLNGVEVPLGTGGGHIAEIIEDLTLRGYDGFLTLEPHTMKYALLRRAFYVCPLLSLAIKGSFGVFRKIDKAMNVGKFEKVTRKQVYIWQYESLLKIIKEAQKNG